jgi:hypothetical protein
LPHLGDNESPVWSWFMGSRREMVRGNLSPSAPQAPPMRRNTPSVSTWPNVEWFRFCGDEPSPPRLTKRLEEVQRGVVQGFIETCRGAGACLFSGA